MNLIAIYVEDHLALSLAGIRLARRCRDENRDGELGAFLERLVPELEEDRAVLRDVAHALGAGASAWKDLAAAAGEWAGRFKLNGRFLRYSELSRVWELEALLAGSDSRRGLWKLLGKVGRKDHRLAGFGFEALEERAKAHREALERHRVRAADAAFRPRRARPRAGAPVPAR
ncbi:hypothetical protein [Anaeromyxobacter oryzae]|uniref:Uncharacterized protein n=1 Tax=Anaeromyxobacter oryzae TaxID=2918170 RepID=A0ABM7WW61_9BACT|nr:hypothetical protein [Anaeromyxobacter oryzae]BDG03715.1 hypothetical protein AMOR_27110 [Anaeromyxobacter oryzae]